MREFGAGDTFHIIIQLPGNVGSIVILDEEFNHLEFDTNEWKIGVGHFGGVNTVKVVYYATETYTG